MEKRNESEETFERVCLRSAPFISFINTPSVFYLFSFFLWNVCVCLEVGRRRKRFEFICRRRHFMLLTALSEFPFPFILCLKQLLHFCTERTFAEAAFVCYICGKFIRMFDFFSSWGKILRVIELLMMFFVDVSLSEAHHGICCLHPLHIFDWHSPEQRTEDMPSYSSTFDIDCLGQKQVKKRVSHISVHFSFKLWGIFIVKLIAV